MSTISQFKRKYFTKIDALDLELLISAAIDKPREFVLSHPEYELKKSHISNLKSQILRRWRGEPLAYILGQKEFYGSEFKVNKNTLIPRPETEQLVELALDKISNLQSCLPAGRFLISNLNIIDIGTGSGNIILSILNKLESNTKYKILDTSYFATDISAKALSVARQNAKTQGVDKKINFLKGNLLKPIIENTRYQIPDTRYLILANLPYLSEKIYNSTSKDVKNYEPKSALYSAQNGLDHYKKLFKQIKILHTAGCNLQVFLEFSPEQKTQLKKSVEAAFPHSHLTFFKDLAGKFRVIQIDL